MREQQFVPSRKTAGLAVAALRPDSQRLDITSSHLPSSDAPIDLRHVQFFLGDTVVKLLGVASEALAPDVGSKSQIIVDEHGKLELELQNSLGDILGLDRTNYNYFEFMEQITAEFIEWAKKDHNLANHQLFITSNNVLMLHCELFPDVSQLE